MSCYNNVMCSVDEGKTVSDSYLGLSKAFDTVSYTILLEKWALVAWSTPQG